MKVKDHFNVRVTYRNNFRTSPVLLLKDIYGKYTESRDNRDVGGGPGRME